MAYNNRLSIFHRHTPHRPSPLRYFTPLSLSPPPQEPGSESSNCGGSESSKEQTTSNRGELENHDDSEKGGSGDDSGPADAGSKIIAGNLVHMGAIIINKRELRTVKIIKEVLKKDNNLIIDNPFSHNEMVAIYLVLCLDVLKQLKLQGKLPETVDEQAEDARKRGIDYSWYTEVQEPSIERKPNLLREVHTKGTELSTSSKDNGQTHRRVESEPASPGTSTATDTHGDNKRAGQQAPQAVILCSSSELAIRTFDIIQTLLSGVGLAVSLATNTDRHSAQTTEISRGCHILIAEPRRFMRLAKTLGIEGVPVMVFDEACDMFRPKYDVEREGLKAQKIIDNQTKCIFFAPWWDEKEKLRAEKFVGHGEKHAKTLKRHDGVTIVQREARYSWPKQDVKLRSEDNMGVLFERLDKLATGPNSQILLLCRQAKTVDTLWERVKAWGVVKRTHLTDWVERGRIFSGWNAGKVRAVITTEDLAGGMVMGHVTELIHWELPMHANLSIAEWKYVRRMERIDFKRKQKTLVFFASEDEALFPFVGKLSAEHMDDKEVQKTHSCTTMNYMRMECGLEPLHSGLQGQ